MTKVVQEFWRVIKEELIKHSSQYAVTGLFLWGIAVLLFSLNLDHIWLAFIYLLITHVLTLMVLYSGFIKDVRAKRAPLAATIGVLMALFTLMIDALFVI